MNLAIDKGNTIVKFGIFSGEKLLHVSRFSSLEDGIETILQKFPEITQCVYANVGSADTSFERLSNMLPCLAFDHTVASPVRNCYGTPQTLGIDRLAAAIGANALYPGREVLVLDAGTALTYEYLSAKAEYLGGNISPGLQMRFKALHTFTAKLPLLEPGKDIIKLGRTTEEAIRAGVENGIIAEAESIIAQFTEKYPKGSVILTGGDMSFFDKRLKNSIFAAPDLVLIGLNEILNYNFEKNTN